MVARMPRGNAITEVEAERVRVVLRKLLADCDNNQSALMRAYPALRQGYVSKLLRGEGKPSLGFLRHLSHATGMSVAQILGDPSAHTAGSLLSATPGYAAAEREAFERAPELADEIRRLSVVHVPDPLDRISSDSLITLANTFRMNRKPTRK